MLSLLSFTILCLCIAYGANSQIGYDAISNTLSCSKPGGRYCLHGSLQGSIIISCSSSVTAEIRACNLELSHVLPEGYGDFAVCYESSDNAGDAICAFNGTGYIPHKAENTIDLPETIICDASIVEEVLQAEKRDTTNQPRANGVPADKPSHTTKHPTFRPVPGVLEEPSPTPASLGLKLLPRDQHCFYPWGKTRQDEMIHDRVCSSGSSDSSMPSVTVASLRPDMTGSLSMHALAETGAGRDAGMSSVISTVTVTLQSVATSTNRIITDSVKAPHETGNIDSVSSTSGGEEVIPYWGWNFLGYLSLSWTLVWAMDW